MEQLLATAFDWLKQAGIPYLDTPWAKFAITIVIAYLFAFVISRVIQIVYQVVTHRTKTQLDEKVLGIMKRPVFWVFFLIGLRLSLYHLVSLGYSDTLLSSLIKSIVVMIVVVTAYRVARELLFHMSRSRKQNRLVKRETLPLFQNLALLFAFVAATYMIFSAWNIDLTAWFASAGILGVAVGFAAKDTLANLISGVFILADAPYRVGDTLILDTGERGEVTHIGLRSTRIYTTDHAEVSIPNSTMGNSRVVNQSGGADRKARVRAPIGVAYGSDIDQVKVTLQKIAIDHEEVCQDPEPRVRFRQFGASSLDFELLFWIDNALLKGRVLDEINTEIYNTFNKLEIEIPFAKQDVYIKEMPKG